MSTQDELAFKFVGSSMESLGLILEAVEKKESFVASEIAASLAKNLMDVSRAFMAQAVMENSIGEEEE